MDTYIYCTVSAVMLAQKAHRACTSGLDVMARISGLSAAVLLNSISVCAPSCPHFFHAGVMLAGLVWLLGSRDITVSKKAEENDAIKAELLNDGPSEVK